MDGTQVFPQEGELVDLKSLPNFRSRGEFSPGMMLPSQMLRRAPFALNHLEAPHVMSRQPIPSSHFGGLERQGFERQTIR